MKTITLTKCETFFLVSFYSISSFLSVLVALENYNVNFISTIFAVVAAMVWGLCVYMVYKNNLLLMILLTQVASTSLSISVMFSYGLNTIAGQIILALTLLVIPLYNVAITIALTKALNIFQRPSKRQRRTVIKYKPVSVT